MTVITYDYLVRLEQVGFTPSQAETLIICTTNIVENMYHKSEVNLEKQIEQSETTLENRIERVQLHTDHLDNNIKTLEQKMEHRFDVVDEHFKLIDQRFHGIDKRLDNMDKRFESMTNLFKWSAGIMITLIPTITAIFNHF